MLLNIIEIAGDCFLVPVVLVYGGSSGSEVNGGCRGMVETMGSGGDGGGGGGSGGNRSIDNVMLATVRMVCLEEWW